MPIIGQISVGDGATFTPSVSSTGELSWTNNKNLPNPATVDIPQAVMDRYQIAPINSPAFTGTPTAPTPDTDDDSTKIATTAYVQAELEDYVTLTELSADLADYLPLAGGTMIGSIITTESLFVKRDSDDSSVLVLGATDITEGAYLGVYGKDHSTQAGRFALVANNGVNTIILYGAPNGDLKWGGKDVITAGNVYDYQRGEELTNGDNLNNFENTGNYYSSNSTMSASLSNCPFNNGGFWMQVIRINTSLIIQTIHAGSNIFERRKTSGGWNAWIKYTGTQV